MPATTRSPASTPGSTIRFTRFGGDDLGGGPQCVVSPDNQSVDCPKGGVDSVRLEPQQRR